MILDLVRFDCGCIGTRPNKDGRSYIIFDCRSASDVYYVGLLSIPLTDSKRLEKFNSYQELSIDEKESIIRRLIDLVRKGHQLETIQENLGVGKGPYLNDSNAIEQRGL